MHNYEQESRSIFGEEQTCTFCDERKPINEMNIIFKDYQASNNVVHRVFNRNKLPGIPFVCNTCKDHMIPPLPPNGDKKRLEKKIKDLEYELSVCKSDLEEVRFHYYGDAVND